MAFMTHPKHGATITTDVKGHEANGWKISTPEEWLGDKFKPSENESGQPAAEPKKRGRPAKAQ